MCTRKSIENIFRPRIHQENGKYWAEIPAMPGCLTIAGTLDELRDNIIEAAHADAAEMLEADPDLATPEHAALRRELRLMLKEKP